ASRPTFVNICIVYSFLQLVLLGQRSTLSSVYERVEGGDPTIVRRDQDIDTSHLSWLAWGTEAPREASHTTVCISIRQLGKCKIGKPTLHLLCGVVDSCMTNVTAMWVDENALRIP